MIDPIARRLAREGSSARAAQHVDRVKPPPAAKPGDRVFRSGPPKPNVIGGAPRRTQAPQRKGGKR